MVQRIAIPKIKFIGKLSNEKKISSFLMVYFSLLYQRGKEKRSMGKNRVGLHFHIKFAKIHKYK